MKNNLSQHEIQAYEEHERELLEEEESITQAIKDLNLNTMSRSELERKVARLILENNQLEEINKQLFKSKTKISTDYLSFIFSDNLIGKFKEVVQKYKSKINSKNAKHDRPRGDSIKPTKDDIESFRIEFLDHRERDGLTGDYGWQKAASRKFGYSERQIRRILKS